LRVLASRERPAARIYCFPGVGGAASAFIPMVPHLPDTIELVAIQAPGRADRYREPPITDTAGFIEEVTAVIAAELNAPSLIFGHSLGGWAAYAIACRLASQPAERPPALGLAVACMLPPTDESQRVLRLDYLQEASDADAVDMLKTMAAWPKNLIESGEDRAALLAPFRADARLWMNRRWVTGPGLDIPLLAIAAARDQMHRDPSRLSPWCEVTTGGFSLASLDGTHSLIADNPIGIVTTLRTFLGELTCRS
jgi:surfactin synthase thioesterase subunit